MSNLARKTADNLRKIRETKPLIHNITNFVVMNSTANVLLAAGASPVMAHAENEVEEMVGFAGALVLNIGTLTDTWVESMLKAGRKATELGRPIVLDPVGAGATALRTADPGRNQGERGARQRLGDPLFERREGGRQGRGCHAFGPGSRNHRR